MALGVACCQLAGLLAARWWIADLTTHFQLQYGMCLGISLLGLMILRSRLATLLVAALLVMTGLRIVPFLPTPSRPEAPIPLSVLLANLWTPNTEHDRVLTLIASTSPDVAVFIEVNDRWRRVIDSLAEYQLVAVPRDDNFGMAVLSRVPVLDQQEMTLGTSGMPTLHVTVASPTGPLHVLAVHPPPPVNHRWWHHRNRQLAAITTLVADSPEPWIVLGDLNTTPWSPSFSIVLRDNHLVNSARRRGLRPTWPARWPWLLRIPIDHCLHSPSISTVACRLGPQIGSDHRPLILELDLAAVPPNHAVGQRASIVSHH